MFRCDMYDKTFKTPQALSSHITYAHRRARMQGITDAPLPPEILNDPEILELRKKLEKKRIQKELDELEETPKIIELVERVRGLEENAKKVEKLETQQLGQDKTLRQLADLVQRLKIDGFTERAVLATTRATLRT